MWIATDKFGFERIFDEKPTRRFGKSMDYWVCKNGRSFQMPSGTANALFDKGLLLDVNIPLYKMENGLG